jgi:hypothetical protein
MPCHASPARRITPFPFHHPPSLSKASAQLPERVVRPRHSPCSQPIHTFPPHSHQALGDLAVPAAATRALRRMCETAGTHPQRRGLKADYGACVRLLIAARAEIDRPGIEGRKENSGAGRAQEYSGGGHTHESWGRGGSKEKSRVGFGEKGRTALAAAAMGDSPTPLIAALLRAGASRDVTDSDGRCVTLSFLGWGGPLPFLPI